jgi:hypothetical protein
MIVRSVRSPAVGAIAAPVEAPVLASASAPVTDGIAEPAAEAKEAASVGQVVPAELSAARVALPRRQAARASSSPAEPRAQALPPRQSSAPAVPEDVALGRPMAG